MARFHGNPYGRRIFWFGPSLLTPYRSTTGYARRSRLGPNQNLSPHSCTNFCNQALAIFFQVVSPPGPLEWKDTVNVPVDGTVSFVVRYDDRPGMWMFHCHILDHAEGGLMGHVQVGPAAPTDHMHPKKQ